MCRRRGGRGGGVRKDGESPRRRRSVMVAETAGSHLAKGQTGSEEEAAGRHRGARAHNSILQMTSAGSPAASPTSRLTSSAANTSRDEVDEATRVAVMSASRGGGRRGGKQGRVWSRQQQEEGAGCRPSPSGSQQPGITSKGAPAMGRLR